MIELLVQLFADDTHHCAAGKRCVEGLEERFEIAELWASFFGMVHRVSKCSANVGKFSEEKDANDRTMKTQEEHGVEVVARCEYKGTGEKMPMVDPHDDIKTLGVQASLAGYSEDAVMKAQAKAGVTALTLNKMPKEGQNKELGVRVATGVGWARLKYRLTFVYAWPERAELACAALKKAVIGRVGMHPGAAKAAVETMV